VRKDLIEFVVAIASIDERGISAHLSRRLFPLVCLLYPGALSSRPVRCRLRTLYRRFFNLDQG
jgi:hypothetical protein